MLKYNENFIKERIVDYLKGTGKIPEDGAEKDALVYIKSLDPINVMVMTFEAGEFYRAQV